MSAVQVLQVLHVFVYGTAIGTAVGYSTCTAVLFVCWHSVQHPLGTRIRYEQRTCSVRYEQCVCSVCLTMSCSPRLSLSPVCPLVCLVSVFNIAGNKELHSGALQKNAHFE